MALTIGIVIVVGFLLWWFATKDDAGDIDVSKSVASGPLCANNPTAPSIEQPIRIERDYSQWPKEPVLQLLLSQFLHPREQQGAIPDYWQSKLWESPQRVVDAYVNSGVLVPAELRTAIEMAFNVELLKTLLRERKLKVSGNKTELIARLIDADADGMREIIHAKKLIEVSFEFRPYVEQFRAKQRLERDRSVAMSLTALREERIDEAVKVTSFYQAEQIFPGGLGIDWSGEAIVSELKESIALVFSSLPSVLKPCVGSGEISALRLAVAMNRLWGENRMHRLVEGVQEKYGKFSAEEAISVFSHFVHEANRLRQFQQEGVKHVEIKGDEHTACTTCRKIIGRRYSIGRLPEIPPTRCTCPISSVWYSPDYNELIEIRPR